MKEKLIISLKDYRLKSQRTVIKNSPHLEITWLIIKRPTVWVFFCSWYFVQNIIQPGINLLRVSKALSKMSQLGKIKPSYLYIYDRLNQRISEDDIKSDMEQAHSSTGLIHDYKIHLKDDGLGKYNISPLGHLKDLKEAVRQWIFCRLERKTAWCLYRCKKIPSSDIYTSSGRNIFRKKSIWSLGTNKRIGRDVTLFK